MLKLLKDAGLKGKRVILRADLDVPLQGGKVSDNYRLKALLPTIKHLLKNDAQFLIIGHAGRPGGKPDSQLSLRPVVDYLSKLLKKKVEFFSELPATGSRLPAIALLENLRFWRGEEENKPAFAKKLASFGDLYVNDAFAVSHRAHASIAGISSHIPSYAGLRLEDEIKELGSILERPARPLIFILGGAKTETKMPLVPGFAKVADKVLIGGLLMFDKQLEGTSNVIFPVDAADAYDIGPESIKMFTQIIKDAKTVVWNGPMGKWEDNRYELGTRAVAEELAVSPAKTVVGGGDTIAALSSFGLISDMKYVSLGGGAMLEFLAGRELPGLKALGYYG